MTSPNGPELKAPPRRREPVRRTNVAPAAAERFDAWRARVDLDWSAVLERLLDLAELRPVR